MFELKEIIVEKGRVNYSYSTSKEISKFFSAKPFFAEYDVDITEVPEGILVIPFLSNVLPIAWFAGFDLKVKTLDKVFYDSVNTVKKQFAEYYPEINSKHSDLIVENLEDYSQNNIPPKNAMLFSGGVDAYTTFLKHNSDSNPLDLITFWGADIPLADSKQWEDLKNSIVFSEVLKLNRKRFITANFREFYNFNVDSLLSTLSWWGYIQHGLALTGVVAPLAYLNNYTTLFIASSNPRKPDSQIVKWGSMPEIDNLIAMGSCQIIHDGVEFNRQDKVKFVVDKSSSLIMKPQIRVCYSELRTDGNCNVCEKCLRTIFSIMIAGANPMDFGFKVEIRVFQYLRDIFVKGFSTRGIQSDWKQIYDRAVMKDYSHFYNGHEEIWHRHYKDVLVLLYQAVKVPVEIKKGKSVRLKQYIINKFPNIFNIYLKIRRKLT